MRILAPTLAATALTMTLIDSSPAEARRGFGIGLGAPRCFSHYEPYEHWCGWRHGKYGCWKGRYVVICK